ncbi:hypothetical protein FB595_1681 [Sphingobium sp. AEW010]|nr:hypothetical protein FB595_1681 [Sphingobium sp. AEW010]TWD14811.1 hypothetical protein FB596_1694 [Sphingobium sp. AEW013]TWD18252.1 hypothetical protein FB594_1941 [Sphingobium sp. AEW001]
MLISTPVTRPSWPPSGRKSTYPDVQFCQATSNCLPHLPQPSVDLVRPQIGTAGNLRHVRTGAETAATSSRFCWSLHTRRRSGPEITVI